MNTCDFRRIGSRVLAGIVLVGWLVTAWGAGRPVGAQDGGEDGGQEEAPLIFDFHPEVIFPAAIRFYVGLNALPRDLSEVRLTVRQDNGLDESIQFDPERDLVLSEGVVTTLMYTWDLAEGAVPTPFQLIHYLLEVQTAAGDVATTDGTFAFEDSANGPWQSVDDPPLILHWQSPRLAGQRLWDETMAAYALLNRHTERVPFFEFAIYDPGARFCQEVLEDDNETTRLAVISLGGTEFPCSLEAYRRLYAASGIVLLKRHALGFSGLEDALIAEMVDQTYAGLWGDVPVPAWFASGLTFMYQLHPNLAAVDVVRGAARTDYLLPLSDLQSDPSAELAADQQTLWKFTSYLMVLYLADTYGADAPFALARTLHQSADGFDGALQALTGGDQDALWIAWKRWLFTDAAGLAAAWTPYLPTTPTPTATPTATPLPPTATVTPTRTVTPVPSSTFSGDQPPTAVVIRVSPTPRPTITNTPLPPGSLPTALPSTSPSGTENDDNTLVTGGIIVLAVSAVVLLVALLSLTRRRSSSR